MDEGASTSIIIRASPAKIPASKSPMMKASKLCNSNARREYRGSNYVAKSIAEIYSFQLLVRSPATHRVSQQRYQPKCQKHKTQQKKPAHSPLAKVVRPPSPPISPTSPHPLTSTVSRPQRTRSARNARARLRERQNGKPARDAERTQTAGRFCGRGRRAQGEGHDDGFAGQAYRRSAEGGSEQMRE